jgi:hypothetical protein
MYRPELARLSLPLGILLLVLFLTGGCMFFCGERVRVSIGKFEMVDDGARAAVEKLSQELKRCPKTKYYSVSWRYSKGPEPRGWRALKYDRRDAYAGIIGYEDDPESGISGDAYIVEDSAIHRVAQERGILEDFARYSKGKL